MDEITSNEIAGRPLPTLPQTEGQSNLSQQIWEVAAIQQKRTQEPNLPAIPRSESSSSKANTDDQDHMQYFHYWHGLDVPIIHQAVYRDPDLLEDE